MSTLLARAEVERIHLDDTSWVDVVRGLLAADVARSTHDELLRDVTWRQNANFRYERNVPEPRLSSYQSGATTHPVLAAVQQWISARYHVRFDGVALAQYRNGRDGVGWHRDREMRWLDDTLIGVLTLGATRPFLIAPLDERRHAPDHAPGHAPGHAQDRSADGPGARSATSAGPRRRIARDHGDDTGDDVQLDLRPAAGDLLVMGGRCQADWLHAVPQLPATIVCPPRISAQWRWTSRTGRRDPNPSYFAPRRVSPGPSSGRSAARTSGRTSGRSSGRQIGDLGS